MLCALCCDCFAVGCTLRAETITPVCCAVLLVAAYCAVLCCVLYFVLCVVCPVVSCPTGHAPLSSSTLPPRQIGLLDRSAILASTAQQWIFTITIAFTVDVLKTNEKVYNV